MAITEKQQRFIEDIAKHVQKYARAYGILVHSPIIAQAILESGWGESKLASKYHNYFGMISTHSLTRRLTQLLHGCWPAGIFQLTASQGG